MADPLAAYSDTINAAAQEWGHDPDMLRALIMQESRANPAAVSKKGARGLTGIMPETATGLGITDPSNTDQQIFGAAKYLAEGRDKEGSHEGALLYYHGGPDWRKAYGPESQGYVPAVAGHYTRLKASAGTDKTAAVPANDKTAAVPSDDEFLKSTAAPAPATASAVPSDDEFLKSTGAPPGKPAASDTPQAEPLRTMTNAEANAKDVAAVGRIASEAGAGAAQGFGSDPLGLSDKSRQTFRDIGVFNQPGQSNPLRSINEALVGGVAAGGDLLLRGGNALVGAYQRGVSQAGTEVGAPQLGRDLAALPEAFPTGDFRGGGTRIPMPAGAPENRLVEPRFIQEHFGEGRPNDPLALPPRGGWPAQVAQPGAEMPPNRLAAAAMSPAERQADIMNPPGSRPPEAGSAPGPQSVGAASGMDAADAAAAAAGWRRLGPNEPRSVGQEIATDPASGREYVKSQAGPQSVGAAASRDMSHPSLIEMTPAEVHAYRSTAEGQKLLEPQQPGIEDRTTYVPGVEASTAEIEQTVNAAREAKKANTEHTEVSQAAKEQAAVNNDVRQRYLETTIKSPVDVANARAARAAQAEADLAETWANKKPADPQPVLDLAEEIKGSQDGRRPLVRSALDSVTAELRQADGTLITDPELLYGVRKHIDDLLSKEAGASDPKSVRAAASLQKLKTALDAVIEPAAPGFRQYLDNFAAASRPIDEMEILQSHQNKLYDAQGRLQLSRVQTMMRNIVDSRAAAGLNPYKSIREETMQRLWKLRDDLRRSASAQELARTPGSDTAQNLFDLARKGAVVGGKLVVHGAANALSPGIGSLIVNAADAAIGNKLAASASRKAVARGMHNLNPNRLRPPEP